MGLLLKQVFGLIRLLNSEHGSHQIAAGVGLGFILGMTPALSLQSFLVFICIFLFRVQVGAALLSAFFFAFAGWLLDPLFHQVGDYVLNMASLQGLFTTMYNMPIVPFTRFNNTIVMGSGVVSILLFPLIYILAFYLVVKYREAVLERFKATKFWKAVRATALYRWYYKYDDLYGA